VPVVDSRERSATDQSVTRRFALRLVGGAVLSIPAALDLNDADALRVWCRTDPVVDLRDPIGLKGNSASIYLSAALEEWELNNSSGDVVVEHPKDAKTSKLWEDVNGYFGQGVSTNFAVNPNLRFYAAYMDVRIRCYIPASRNDMQIRLDWAPGPIQWDANGDPLPAKVIASATGLGNQWIALKSKLPYTK
jgi:hypothetical protein